MIESFLQFVWKYQYYDISDLYTSDKDPATLQVIHPGYQNKDSGPDFSLAKVNISGISWHGQVEVHYKSSGWYAHQHDQDPAYDNVILHVVWNHDQQVFRSNGSVIPTLELKNRINHDLLHRYQNLINNPDPIPCSRLIPRIREITLHSMLDRSLMDRMERKSTEVLSILEKNNNDWEETAYQLISRSFGFKTNADAFLKLSQLIPYKIIQKHFDQLFQIEALFFGQAGFLEESQGDDYYENLRGEYHFLSKKYQLYEKRMSRLEWKFSRLRPFNFPTIRIAQLAKMMSQKRHVFSFIKEYDSVKILLAFLNVTQSDYWNTHYDFGKRFKTPINGIGKKSLENIAINTIALLLITYGQYHQQNEFIDRGINLLQTLPSEQNHITKMWKGLNVKTSNAYDSQACIELFQQYCNKRRCLSCNIGAYLVQNN